MIPKGIQLRDEKAPFAKLEAAYIYNAWLKTLLRSNISEVSKDRATIFLHFLMFEEWETPGRCTLNS